MIYAASLNEVAKESPLFFRDWGDAESQGAALAHAMSEAGHKNAPPFDPSRPADSG